MKKLYFLLFALSIMAVQSQVEAQTTHDISLENFTFSPEALTIEVGDIVRWTNNGGTHFVDANAETFPDNPTTFGNEAGQAGWVYEFTFDLAGEYNYRCGIHTSSMFGSITVNEDPLSVSEAGSDNQLSFFPNPAVDQLVWKWADNQTPQNKIMRLFDVNGKLVSEINMATVTRLNVSAFENGMYFYSVFENNEKIQTGNIMIAHD